MGSLRISTAEPGTNLRALWRRKLLTHRSSLKRLGVFILYYLYTSCQPEVYTWYTLYSL